MVKTKPVIIAKTFLLSKLNYIILALPLSRDIAAQTDSIILGSCGRKKNTATKKLLKRLKEIKYIQGNIRRRAWFN